MGKETRAGRMSGSSIRSASCLDCESWSKPPIWPPRHRAVERSTRMRSPNGQRVEESRRVFEILYAYMCAETLDTQCRISLKVVWGRETLDHSFARGHLGGGTT